MPVAAWAQDDAGAEQIDVYGQTLSEGPKVEGVITARTDDEILVRTPEGANTAIFIDDRTEVKARGGFLGLGRDTLTLGELLNGVPVEVETLQYEGGLIASRVNLRSDDLETASMIRDATSQRFAQQDQAISANAAAAEALRGRVGDIDKYNIKGTENVYFDTARWNLSADAERRLCEVAEAAGTMDNALLLVVGYTDSDGSQDYNQELSERRAGRVVNFLQQECDWEPWRMLTPTGMAEADPLADNTTPEGKAQNRRVSVNILVSKAVEGG
jgi:outer membrane protein OmpA-like peptidoglycan-associated protein